MTRNGGFENANLAPQIDNLDYTYFDNSNQLKRVTDSTNDSQGFNNGSSAHNDDYTYDTYGNMISDTNKNITQIRYNHQNLPVEIDFANNQKISYLYDASGTKLQKQVQYTNYTITTDYIGGYQYETKPVAQGGLGHPQLLFFPTAEGYVKAIYKMDPSETEPRRYQYVYIYKDHLGNNRLSYTLDPETEQVKILEENHYYPFGLHHNTYTPTKKDIKYQEQLAEQKEIKQVQPAEVVFKYKYNGKELQEELGIGVYDYGARIYDPAVPRFWTIDPLAEKYPTFSPYNYTLNSPINLIDPNGKEPFVVIIKGKKSKEAFKQLNASTSLRLKIDNNGKVTAKGKAKTAADKTLLEAINSKTVEVNINATESNFTKEGKWFVGGAFEGSEVKDGKTITNQTVNPKQTKMIDDFYGVEKGVSVLHEVLESYIGGKDSPGIGSPTFDDVQNKTATGVGYEKAHNKANELDSRHISPNIVVDPNGIYITKFPYDPAIPKALNPELLINDLKK